MSEQHLYYMIHFTDTDAEMWFHWELFKSEKDAEDAVWDVIERNQEHDVFHYSIKPIPVRS